VNNTYVVTAPRKSVRVFVDNALAPARPLACLREDKVDPKLVIHEF
jgi:hypothetical protein